jgi:glutamine synthetase
MRVPGSDCNPYLGMAASLASGLYGIKNNLKLETPPVTGNGYEDKSNGILPGNLSEATKRMRESSLAVELLGETFIDHFVRTREWEWREYCKSVSDWELKRYFEIV